MSKILLKTSTALAVVSAALITAPRAQGQSSTETLLEIVTQTPGITLTGTTQLGGININVRGRNALGETGGGGVVVDGILMSNPSALTRTYPDLDNVKIMKGPQGRGANAAAVLVTTRKPGEKFESGMAATLADDNTYALQGTAGGPLVLDRVYFSLTANARTTDGFFRNTFLDSPKVDDANAYGLGGRIIFVPGDEASLDVKMHWDDSRSGNSAFDGAFALPAFAQFLKRPLFNEDINAHAFAFQSNIRPVHRQRAAEVSAKWDQDLTWATLTVWLLYSDLNNNLTMDGIAGAFGTFSTDATCIASVASQFAAGRTLPQPQNLGATPDGSLFGIASPTACDGTHFQLRNQNAISTEIRLTSPRHDRLRWTLIGSYQHINRHAGVNVGLDKGQGALSDLYVPPTGVNPTEQLFDDTFKTNAASAFADAAYDILPDVELTASLGYERERQSVRNRVPPGPLTAYVTHSFGAPFTGGAPLNPALSTAAAIPGQGETFDQFVPKVGLSWAALDNVVLNVSWGVGFKSGGFNNLGTGATVNAFINGPLGAGLTLGDRFAGERSSAAEGGIQARFFGGRFVLDGTGYYTRVRNLQFAELLAGPFGLLRAVDTIDKVRIYGGEIEATAEVLHGFSIFAGAGLESARILAMTSRPDAAGNRVPLAPEYTVRGGLNWAIPVADGLKVFGRTAFAVTGPTAFHAIQCQSRPTSFGVLGNYCGSLRKSFITADARAGVRSDRWSIAAYVKNIANDRHVGEAIIIPEFGQSLLRPGDLRRIGADLSLRF